MIRRFIADGKRLHLLQRGVFLIPSCENAAHRPETGEHRTIGAYKCGKGSLSARKRVYNPTRSIT